MRQTHVWSVWQVSEEERQKDEEGTKLTRLTSLMAVTDHISERVRGWAGASSTKSKEKVTLDLKG